VFRRVAPFIGLMAGLAPAMALAQTDIDEGKTPAQIFASTCATCHKSPRGLASGRGSLMLRGFLAEHYTSNRDQAAALAAYVLGAGGGDNVPAAQDRTPKPGLEHARLPVEEPKPPARSTRRADKREGQVPGNAKLQPPTDEDARPGSVPSIMAEPGSSGGSDAHPVVGRRENPAHHPEPLTPPPALESAPVVAEPTSHQSPPQGSESGAGPGLNASAPSTDSDAPVPRDSIPD